MAYSYTRIPGSGELKTETRDKDPEAAALDALAPTAPAGRFVRGEWLTRAVVRARYVPVLLDVYDRLSAEQSAVEQAVYGHLYRLSVAGERNHCRVTRRDLSMRTNLSERRLGKALAGLVDKGHIRPVHRDRRGTLYRVLLPHEVFGESDGESVHLVRPPKDGAPAPAPTAHAGASTRTPLGPTPAKETTAPKRERSTHGKSPGGIAAAFIERHGEAPGRSRSDIVEAVFSRLEEGRTFVEIEAELDGFARRAPKRMPLLELARFLERADKSG